MDPDNPTVEDYKAHRVRTKCSHPDCNACAREFFKWWKTREAQMSSGKHGPSFQAAAVTSVKAK